MMELLCRCLMYCCVKFDTIRKNPGGSDDIFGEAPQDEENPEGAPEEKPKAAQG